MVRIAITKGRIEKDICKILEKAGYDIKNIINKERELIVKMSDNIEVMFTKSNDTLAFIQNGICDLGVVGKDTLDESDVKEYSELLDLNVGNCYFALAGLPEYKKKSKQEKKVIATKYPNITKKYFFNKQEDVEIIKMEGSVELRTSMSE